LFNPGDVVAVHFPGVTGVKRRPLSFYPQRCITPLGLTWWSASLPAKLPQPLAPPITCSRIGCKQVCGSRPLFAASLLPCLPLPTLFLSDTCLTETGRGCGLV